MNRRARDRRIAQEFADELSKALGGPVPPEALTANGEIVCEIFGRVLDRHQIVTESAAACVLRCVPRVLAKNFQLTQSGRDAARGKRHNELGAIEHDMNALGPAIIARAIAADGNL
jgi:hypothetical protein